MKSEEFIREVDEELRRDRIAMLWRRYGSVVLAVAVLIVLGTAGKVGWDQWRHRQGAAEAMRFVAAERALAAGQGADIPSYPDEADHLVKLTDGRHEYIIDAERVAWVRLG